MKFQLLDEHGNRGIYPAYQAVLDHMDTATIFEDLFSCKAILYVDYLDYKGYLTFSIAFAKQGVLISCSGTGDSKDRAATFLLKSVNGVDWALIRRVANIDICKLSLFSQVGEGKYQSVYQDLSMNDVIERQALAD